MIDENKLKTLHYAPPIITNAQHNRDMVVKCFKAGKTPKQIAEHFPKVFRCDADGLLGQIYDSEYGNTGIYETKYMITDVSVVSFTGSAVNVKLT